MTTIDSTNYPPAIAELLRLLPLAPLGPGKPHHELQGQLAAVEAAFPPRANRDLAAACRAGLWLAFNFLDESHRLSQEVPTVEGSYWHALMHRREPDFDNSKYWFRRVGTHPVFEPLRLAAAGLAANGPAQAAFLTRQATWDPFAFVDLCEASRDEKASCHDLCLRIQRAEWELLFDFCFRRCHE